METRIALIGIIVENPDVTEQINRILHEYSGYVIGRTINSVAFDDFGLYIANSFCVMYSERSVWNKRFLRRRRGAFRVFRKAS